MKARTVCMKKEKVVKAAERIVVAPTLKKKA
jgi:hypothetical protein